MSKAAVLSSNPHTGEVIDLKDPIFAATLGFFIPGLGHLYQGRVAKGLLFMICILGTFFFGLARGGGKVVYASRLHYACQVWVGIPALPALVQEYLVNRGKAPILGGVMAPPANENQLNEWHRTLHHFFELGTVYTMIAGLLNVLVMYDAWGGPIFLEEEEEKPKDDPTKPNS